MVGDDQISLFGDRFVDAFGSHRQARHDAFNFSQTIARDQAHVVPLFGQPTGSKRFHELTDRLNFHECDRSG